MKLIATTLILFAAAPFAWASVAAPEIDGNSIASGVALAAGAVLVLRSRRK
jgi:hypothetical protein